MICKNCGNVIPDESIFCTECGTMVASQPEVQVPDFNYPPVQAENYDYADGTIPEEEVVYDPETNAENAKAFITAGAKSKLPLAIVSVSLHLGVAMMFALLTIFFPPFGSIAYFFLCLAALIAGIICLCISKKSVKELPTVIPEMLDPELLEEYNSVEKKLNPVRILHKAGTIYYLVSGIISGLGLIALIAIPVLIVGALLLGYGTMLATMFGSLGLTSILTPILSAFGMYM